MKTRLKNGLLLVGFVIIFIFAFSTVWQKHLRIMECEKNDSKLVSYKSRIFCMPNEQYDKAMQNGGTLNTLYVNPDLNSTFMISEDEGQYEIYEVAP